MHCGIFPVGIFPQHPSEASTVGVQLTKGVYLPRIPTLTPQQSIHKECAFISKCTCRKAWKSVMPGLTFSSSSVRRDSRRSASMRATVSFFALAALSSTSKVGLGPRLNQEPSTYTDTVASGRWEGCMGKEGGREFRAACASHSPSLPCWPLCSLKGGPPTEPRAVHLQRHSSFRAPAGGGGGLD